MPGNSLDLDLGRSLRAAPAAHPERGRPDHTGKRKSARHGQQERQARWLFLAPITVVLLLLTAIPFVYMVAISLTDKSGQGHRTRFIGFENYGSLLSDVQFWNAARVTAVITVIAVAIELALGLVVALALSRLRRNAMLRTLMLLPMAAAPVAVMFNWRVMLNASFGVVNYILGHIGLPQPDWFGSQNLAITSLILIDIWQWTPFVIIVLAGGIAGLPNDLIESANTDGAGPFDTFRYIVLPYLAPYIVIAALFRSIDTLKLFDSIQILTSGGPGSATTTINYYIVQDTIHDLAFGKAAAASILLVVVCVALAKLLLRSLSRQA